MNSSDHYCALRSRAPYDVRILLPSTSGELLCYQTRLDTFTLACDPTFPACPEGSLNTTQVTNATVTVNSDDGNGGTITATVDATEAANSIVHRCDNYTCGSLAYILLANYSTQYCLGFAPGKGYAADYGYIYIEAVVSVEYTGGSGRLLFIARFDGPFSGSLFHGNPSCSFFRIDNTPTILTNPPDGSTLSTFTDCTSSTDSPANEPTTSVPSETTSPSLTSSSSPPSDHTLTASVSSPPDITAVSTHTSTLSTPGLYASSTQQTEEDLQLLLNPDIIEQKVFDIGMNLSTGQSIEVNNIYVYRSVLEDLCATEWTDTSLNGNQFSLPANYFCERNDQSKDGNDQLPVTIGIVTSARLADLLNNKTANNATTGNNDVNLRVASNVITATVFIGHELVSISFSFRLIHSTMNCQKYFSPTCSFWDTKTRKWSSTGCRETSTDKVNMTSCYCDHMTSFAILVSLLPSELDGDIISDILTWVGLGLSVTSLVIGLIMFFILRRSLTADRVIIHANLMIAILFFDITFFAGINPIEIESGCKAYALILHYFSLAMMFWMLVEGIHLYRQIIQVFDSGNPRTWGYGILGWGGPAVILIITGGVKHQSYGYEQSCWLNPTDGTIWAFTGPAMAIVLVNVFILLLVVKTVVSASRGQLDNDKIKQIKAGLRSTLLLFPLLGIAWLLTPVVAVFPHVKALEYTFNLLNSLQGFFVAWLYCFLNSEVRNAIREHIRKSRESRASITNPSTVSTTEGSAAKPGKRLIRVAPAPAPVGPTQNQDGVSIHST